MVVRFHAHARVRMIERGATEAEVVTTVQTGETFPVKFGRTGFRRNFSYNGLWRGRHYPNKQVEAIAVPQDDGWLVITVLVKFF